MQREEMSLGPEGAEWHPEPEVPAKPTATEPKLEGQMEHKEAAQPLGVEFFVTDHNLRFEANAIEQQRQLYAEMQRHGMSSIRFDWDWKEVVPSEGGLNQAVLDKYTAAMEAMKETGLKPPTLVISNPPEWAAKLYRKDKEGFFRVYEGYVGTVAEALAKTGLKVEEAQLFNEINHAFLFKYIDLEDLPRTAGIVRNAMGRVQPDIKLQTSLIVSSFNDAIAEKTKQPTLDEFFAQHGQMLRDNFDRISLDYYPGMWHYPMRKAKQEGNAFPIPVSDNWLKELGNRLNRTFKNMDLLKRTCEQVAGWGKEYEIGELGFPTNKPYSTGKRQRLFYDMFFRAFRQMLLELQSQGVALPKRVGIYETQDEANVSFGGPVGKLLQTKVGRFLSRLTPNPEHDFGMKDAQGKPKEVLQGNLHRPELSEMSRLGEIVRYVNRPVRPSAMEGADRTNEQT
jgi:hypothetical protein